MRVACVEEGSDATAADSVDRVGHNCYGDGWGGSDHLSAGTCLTCT